MFLTRICNATEERQTEVRELAKKSDAMIVIGGRHSSNTQKLFEISKKECSNTFYIQTKNDLNMEVFLISGCSVLLQGLQPQIILSRRFMKAWQK